MKIEIDLVELVEIETLLQKFIDKVDKHKARSAETYNDIKYILALLRRKRDALFQDAPVKTGRAPEA